MKCTKCPHIDEEGYFANYYVADSNKPVFTLCKVCADKENARNNTIWAWFKMVIYVCVGFLYYVEGLKPSDVVVLGIFILPLFALYIRLESYIGTLTTMLDGIVYLMGLYTLTLPVHERMAVYL